MDMLTTAAVVFISVVLASESADPQFFAEVSANASSLSISIPSFVDMSKVYDARNFTVVGYSTMRSIRVVIGNIVDCSGVDDVNVALSRADFKMSPVCHAQHTFGVEVVKTVES